MNELDKITARKATEIRNDYGKGVSFLSTCRSLAFHDGAEFVEPILTAFAEWLGEGFVKVHGGWIGRYSGQIGVEIKSTGELKDFYIKNIWKQDEQIRGTDSGTGAEK